MKFITLFSTLLAVASAAPLAEEAVAQDIQAEKPNVDMTANGVKILKRFEETQPKDGATRKVVKYGTFSVVSSKMMQQTKLAQGPCPTGGCYVTAMEATIRYPDGKEANIDTQAWLHHIALFGSGAGGGSIWACGNERPTLRLNENHKYGLDFPSAFMLMIDLMTESTTAKSLTLEIAYEYIPKLSPNGYKPATMYWLTVGEPAAKDGVYHFTSQTSMVNGPGQLLYAIGHMHDGGTHMSLFKSGSKEPLCKSVMHYNLRKGYTPDAGAAGMAGMAHGHSRRDGHGGHGGGTDHISDPGACTDFGSVARGDRMYSEAWYDANAHPLMVHNGKKENLMGNMRVYIGPTP